MRGVSAKVGVGLILAVGASAMSWGCAENESTLFIVGVGQIESSCSYSPSASAALLPRGQYDIGFNGSYQVGLVLGNQMASRGVKSRSRSETSRIILEGAEVTLVNPKSGGEFLPAFSAPGAGFVDVGSGEQAGYGILSVVVIPRQDAADQPKLLEAGYLIAEIKAFGHTLGGQEVESNVFRFPIEICYGCLVTFPPSEVNVSGECVGSSTSETGAPPCNWGQDTQVVCSACSYRFPVCQRRDATLP